MQPTPQRIGWAALVLLLLLVAAPPAFAQPEAEIESVIVYQAMPDDEDVARLIDAGVRFHLLANMPIALVRGTAEQAALAAEGANVRSVGDNAYLDFYLDESTVLIGAPLLRSELGYTGQGIGVAVIDSGVNGQHDDLPFGSSVAQNVLIHVDQGSSSEQDQLIRVVEDVVDSDAIGHGTHAASTLAGSGLASNGQYAGVAPGAHLVSVGLARSPSVFWALAAFDWVLHNQALYDIRVVNAGWGVVGPFDPNAPINVATRALADAGITVVFPVGNGGPYWNTLNAFSRAPWVIAVAASEGDQRVAYFSARGVPGDPSTYPTITAPGVKITAARDPSSFMGAVISPDPNAAYMATSGTSAAAPHVAGVVALMLEANPALTPDEVKSILSSTAIPLARTAPYQVGAGFLNAEAAVRTALELMLEQDEVSQDDEEEPAEDGEESSEGGEEQVLQDNGAGNGGQLQAP